MGTFITNAGDQSLSERLTQLIRYSSEMKFLVGFFYFSGVRELYETLSTMDEQDALKEGHLKILVGLNVDRGIHGLYEAANTERRLDTNNASKVRERVLQELHKSLREAGMSKELDKPEVYEQVPFFLKLLKKGKIQLRKTVEPTHAKLYLFKMGEPYSTLTPHLFITGSSNLTRAGMQGQYEFNVEIKDYGFEEAERFFDELWDRSVPLGPEEVRDLEQELTQKTMFRQITPFEAYVYLLRLYLQLHEGKQLPLDLPTLLQEAGYKPYKYQLEAVAQAVNICETHGGVLLADVVGLGKTLLACMVANTIGKRGIVICPPHLVGDYNAGWRKYLKDFKLANHWEVFSLGKLDEALDYVKKNDNVEMVIVDEAHRFRNENTVSYHYLHEICRGRTVVLLTATPFNNRPADIFALLKLFTVPKKSTIVLDGDLESLFDRADKEFKLLADMRKYWKTKPLDKWAKLQDKWQKLYGSELPEPQNIKRRAHYLARRLRSVLEPVVIRRNRLDLQAYGEHIDMPKVRDPEEWFYELTPEQSAFYDKVIQYFDDVENGGRFTGAVYFPERYVRATSVDAEELDESVLARWQRNYHYQRNLYDLLRRLLVKRFESSFGAFAKSVERLMEIERKALLLFEKTGKFVFDRKFLGDLDTEDADELMAKLTEFERQLEDALETGTVRARGNGSKVYSREEFANPDQLIGDLRSDIRLFEEVLQQLRRLGLEQGDPKARRLVEGLRRFLEDGRKVVIFTEYVDTARHLEEILGASFNGQVLAAYDGISEGQIRAIYENFDAQYKTKRDQYQILLTTDKLSEGFNLNRAGAVINYDIPWNPVRVIQRVGRINRIGKKVYDDIYIVNFFPTEQGADLVKSREVAQHKMFMIHNVLGEDSKIFDIDEEPQPAQLYRKLTTYSEGEEVGFLTKVRREYLKITNENPGLTERIRDLPNRIKVAKQDGDDELMVFFKKGNDMFVGYKSYSENRVSHLSFEDVYDKARASREEKGLPLSDAFWENYQTILDAETGALGANKASDYSKAEKEAMNMLNHVLKVAKKSKHPSLEAQKEFVSNLLEDLKEFRTLSRYVVERIRDWDDLKDEPSKLASAIAELRNEIGDSFLERALERAASEEGEVIIAIENQRGGGVQE